MQQRILQQTTQSPANYVKQGPPEVELTFVTIETNVDPHDETTTTTTIVHMPFNLSPQCPPPKVISWMKSSNKSSSRQKSHQHRHHHSHNSSRLEKIFPFLHRRRDPSSDQKTKKGNHSFTVFSIQVTVLGKVLIPSGDPQKQHEEGRTQSEEDLLAPTRTVPAQLNRSETTSYVIHRTFEDFQHLSEMVLSLQDQLDHDQHNKHNNNNNHKNTPFSSSSQYQDSNNYTEGQQHLRALRLHHPHPSLFYTLVKQFLFSNAKANQRAFDASSTTHGFDEEGAYERIIELTQFLEEVWHRLLFTTEEPCFYQEQHEIMLWFKPSTDSSHPDGRQMRDRQEQDQKRLQALQQQYQRTTTPALAKKRVTIEASPTLVEQPHLQHDYNLSMSSGSSSTASMPALSSPSSSSVSSMSTSAVGNHEELVGHASSSPTVSDYDNPMENAHLNSTEAVVYDETTNHNKNDDLRRRHTICEGTKKSVGSHLNPTEKITAQDHVPSDHQSTTTTLQSDLEPMPVFKPRNNKRSSTLGNTSGTAASSGADKIKRRISFSHVFRSLTSSSYQRHYPNGHPAKSASSASTPTSPRMDSFDEILIWNTVTSKNTPKHAL